MIIFDYSFTNTGGGGRSRLKHAVHSIPIFFKKFFSRTYPFSVDMRMLLNDY